MTAPLFARPSLVRTLAIVMLAIAAMFSVDALLAKVEQRESRAEAKRYFDSGQSLIAQGRPADAVEQFRSAMAVERDNRNYRLALGEAQLAGGQLEQAASTLNDLLESEPFSGAANLTMARVRLRQGDPSAAISLYHRAIYGRWSENPEVHQIEARFELVDLLDRESLKPDLLAELLPLQEQARDDLATRKKLGGLFLDAGSAPRAAEIFRSIVREQPEDADAHAGLGEAEFAAGNYRDAQAEFRASLELRPDDRATRDRLTICDEVLELSPTRRGLSQQEQYDRSRRLVQAILEDVGQCPGSSPDPLLDTVDQGLKKRTTINQNLDWADELWQIRKMECKRPLSAQEQPLSLVLGMLAR